MNFSPVPVTTSLADTTIAYDPKQVGPGDEWELGYIHVHLLPLPENAPVGQPNECIINIVEFKKDTDLFRSLQIDLKTDSMGGVIGIAIEPTDEDRSTNFVRTVSVEKLVHEIPDQATGATRKVWIPFHHWQLMGMLSGQQSYLLDGVEPASRTFRFCLNVLACLENMSVVFCGETSRLMEAVMEESTWSLYDVKGLPEGY
jgi:hypothetical protein